MNAKAQSNNSERPRVTKILSRLKDFQRATVEYAFRRMYLDDDRVSRFLIADEVGLGKTLVARGIVAKAVDFLWETNRRIDIVYICSNLEIAQQNIDRLNITAERVQLATRATLLPVQLNRLSGNKFNFVSLTPGTSFNLRSTTGVVYERVLLYYLVRKVWPKTDSALSNVLRADVKRENWKAWVHWFQTKQATNIDQQLQDSFLSALHSNPDLMREFEELVREIGGHRKYTPDELRWERNRLIGEFRTLLARTSLSALEPDLVILDEFQRFKYLLEQNDPLASLANQLFSYPAVKVLLISATPYKMYTLQGEQDEDHYQDFLRTTKFLLEDLPGRYEQLTAAIESYRQAIFRISMPENRPRLQASREEFRMILSKVMVRTERLTATQDRNGMLRQPAFRANRVQPSDLQAFFYLDQIAQAIKAGDQVEYWKSAAYPLNLMDAYNIKRRLRKVLEVNEDNTITGWLRRARSFLLDWGNICKYTPIDPGNARLRALVAETLDTGNWRLLWMPPSMPYYRPEGPFAELLPHGKTKTLIFSSWQIVPKTIAVLISYEAERRILAPHSSAYSYDQLNEKRRPLLRFALSQGRLTGMSNFCLLYPCLTLARQIDPLHIACNLCKNGALPTVEQILSEIEARIRQLLKRVAKRFPKQTTSSGVDESWYWFAPLLIDHIFEPQVVREWLEIPDDRFDLSWAHVLDQQDDDPKDDEGPNRYMEHISAVRGFFAHPETLGNQPKDLVPTLARMALASPAICTLRALLRRTGSDGTIFHMAAAAQVGMGFRTLFNQPETILLIQDQYPNTDYWKAALEYAVIGNLQAVLDEYVHILHDSLGLIDSSPGESALKIGEKIREALDIRAPLLRFEEFVGNESEQGIHLEDRRIRCRYALRIGDDTFEEFAGRTRAADVREAFNSPFRPFVLASTSIGQEGLDFHQYCHRIMHWNLPSNPVDLEQREGRIHRYKGHVIRRNLAEQYCLAEIPTSDNRLLDPWEYMFETAKDAQPVEISEIVPFWVYPGSYAIERLVPLLPLSREYDQLEKLTEALVIYRSVIGQPRQQELLQFLAHQLSEDELNKMMSEFTIDLSPPGLY